MLSMSFNRTLVKLLALAGMVFILLIAYQVDRLERVLQIESELYNNPLPLLWLYQLSDEILAAVLLLLAWFSIFKGRSTLISGIYLLIGLLIGLYNPLILSLHLTVPFPSGLAAILMPGNRVALAGAFLTMTGLTGLIVRRRAMWG